MAAGCRPSVVYSIDMLNFLGLFALIFMYHMKFGNRIFVENLERFSQQF